MKKLYRKLVDFYKKFEKDHPKVFRLGQFIFSAFVIYMVFKAPVIWFLTEIVYIHYVFSGFIAGSIITILNYFPAEFLIWKKKEEKELVMIEVSKNSVKKLVEEGSVIIDTKQDKRFVIVTNPN